MPFTTRPVITGTHGVVAAGHYLAAQAGLRMLEQGGNAIDAGVAAGFALAVLKPQDNGIAGEAPILLYAADQGQAFALNGNGCAPRAATISRMKKLGIKQWIPGDGFLPAVVPAMVDAYVTALAVFGTMTLEDVMGPALELAESGFAVYPELHRTMATYLPRWWEHYPSSLAIFAPEGKPLQVGDLLVQSDWAAAMSLLVEAERGAARQGRVAALRAARDVFYRGELAREMVRFSQETEVMDASGLAHSGLLTEEDFAAYSARVEPTVTTEYRGLTVHKCNTWCQGPVFLQQLNLLEGFDLKAMGPNTADSLHTLIECAKLAFADREAYYGDPQFTDVPLTRLLSKSYADRRRKLVDPQRASREDRPGTGSPSKPRVPVETGTEWPVHDCGDTTQLDVVDRNGNMISITPSGGWFSASPVVPGLGFPLGTRGQMFFLQPDHPNRLQPGKRPRSTLTPSLVTKDGRPWMVFGTPGGDAQDQWTLQFFLNYVDHGMDLQEAIDAPTVYSAHFRSSFYPRNERPGVVAAESRLSPEVAAELEARGHTVEIGEPWANGQVVAVRFHADTGLISGAASPRGVSYCVGW